jgi:16S rRNA (uracil1498-N3)-methyltransferase
VDRWERIVIASAKQCGRARLPQIHRPRAFAEWMTPARGVLRLMLVEPGAATRVAHLRDAVKDVPEDASVIVGPEGGWAPGEIDHAAAAGAQLVTLGARTLRADAVALVVLSMLQFAWE